MVAIMTCGTAGGTAGQIAEKRVTLRETDLFSFYGARICLPKQPREDCLRKQRQAEQPQGGV